MQEKVTKLVSKLVSSSILYDYGVLEVVSCADGSWLVKLSHLLDFGVTFGWDEKRGNLTINLTRNIRY